MPPTTATPMPLREAAPAPVAMASGIQPMMKARDVMMIGRKRRFADSSADFTASMPLSLRIFANSTIKIAFFAARPISMMIPICM